MTVEISPQIQQITQELDRLIAEMTMLRSQVARLSNPLVQSGHSVQQAEYFGMWADREDIQSSREWLEQLRTQQWRRQ